MRKHYLHVMEMHTNIAMAQEVQGNFGEGGVAQNVLDGSIGEALFS